MQKPISPRTASLLVAFVVGCGVFAVGCLSDVLLLATGASPWLALIDDFAVGAFAAAVVLFYEWRRNADLRRKLGTVARMNHYVRNQLEVIEYSAWATHDQAHMTRMHACVTHIAWALREILGDEYLASAAPLPKLPAAGDTRVALGGDAPHALPPKKPLVSVLARNLRSGKSQLIDSPR